MFGPSKQNDKVGEPHSKEIYEIYKVNFTVNGVWQEFFKTIIPHVINTCNLTFDHSKREVLGIAKIY